ncbi:MAG: M48 family metallopeptidase, partial [Planctomycetaceae bacterium]|nr:M48 family metallopeptidase [Planctomycetaceae bacterium]
MINVLVDTNTLTSLRMNKKSSKTVADIQVTRQQLLEMLDEKLPKVPATIGYRMGLLVVGLSMLLMPLLYLGLLGALCFVVYWCWVFLSTYRGDNFPWLLAVAAFAAAVTILFLIKPFFGRRAARNRPVRLKRDANLFLFEYVEKICDTVGAPYPISIRVDCIANASAGLRYGLGSIFSNDLVLTIGLPLAAGMNVRQFSGVLAHEFGHFSQGYGMRLNMITMTINNWFIYAAYQRDAWDYRLEHWSKVLPFRLAILIWALRACIWVSRKFLGAICLVGHAISFYMLRQMEFDADRYEIRLSGTKNFKKSTERLSLIGIGFQMAINDIEELYNEERLPDNLPNFAVTSIPNIPSEFLEKMKKHQEEQQTAWHHTHPTDRERIAHAEKLDAEGSMRSDTGVDQLPASVLFHEFDKLCRASTTKFYEERLGTDFKKSCLRNTDALIKERDQDYEAGKALDRY